MKFLSIPQNGSSWSSQLIYLIDSESDEAANIDIEITDSSGIIATKRLYGVVQAEIDIAPILRSVADMRILPTYGTSIRSSCIARKVVVRANGLASDERIFYSSEINVTYPRMLSRMPISTIEYGQRIVFSVVAQRDLNIKIEAHSATSTQSQTLTHKTDSLPVDVVIDTQDFNQKCERIDITISSQLIIIHRLSVVVESASAGRRIVWRNSDGGIESYQFPWCIRQAQEAIIDKVQTAERSYSMLRNAKQHYRLCSALEEEDTLRELADMMLAPYVYEMQDGQLSEVELDSRSIEYDSHGLLRNITLEISADWKGGER